MTDIRTEKIISIREIPYNHKYVYDFSVKDNETFALSNGLMVHNTLNTFHLAGVSSKSNVNQGVPRLRELLSITKNPKTPSLTLYLDQEKIQTKDDAVDTLKEVEKMVFDYFVESVEIYFDPAIYEKSSVIEEDKDFVSSYYNFESWFDDDLNIGHLSPWLLRIKIDPLMLLSKHMYLIDIIRVLKEELSKKFNKIKINIIYSNENSENIVFHIRIIHDDINKKTESDRYVTNNDINHLNLIENYLMHNLIIRGNKNIKSAYVRELKDKYIDKKDGSIKTKNIYVIDTTGTDLKNCILYDFVDKNKIISNDLHEMLETFGIEVARELLKSEIMNIIKSNGIYLNERHLDLLCDLMTCKGILNSIDRHGMKKADAGPLTKMSFEEAENQLSIASIHNHKDTMSSITSSLIMGQIGKYGTGFPELIFDDEAFDNLPEEEEKEESFEEEIKEEVYDYNLNPDFFNF